MQSPQSSWNLRVNTGNYYKDVGVKRVVGCSIFEMQPPVHDHCHTKSMYLSLHVGACSLSIRSSGSFLARNYVVYSQAFLYVHN